MPWYLWMCGVLLELVVSFDVLVPERVQLQYNVIGQRVVEFSQNWQLSLMSVSTRGLN